MKTLLGIFIMLGLCGTAHANAPSHQSASPMKLIFTDTTTFNGTNCSTGTTPTELTQMFTSSDQQWSSIAVENLDATNLVVVSEQPSPSCSAGNRNSGWVLSAGTPGGANVFTLVPGQRLYCLSCNATLSAAGTGPANVAIGRGR